MKLGQQWDNFWEVPEGVPMSSFRSETSPPKRSPESGLSREDFDVSGRDLTSSP